MSTVTHRCAGYLRLIEKGALLNMQNNEGVSALINAAYHGNLEIVEMIMNAGGDCSLKGQHGLTAIEYARSNNKPEIVKILKKYKSCDVSQ